MLIRTFKLSQGEDITLTTYIPDISEEMKNMNQKPAVLIIPGGAYRFCSDREAEPVALEFTARGYNAFVLKYSLNEKSAFPTPLNDAREALEMIIDNSVAWHTDPERIAVCGFSAGGHLAAALCTMSEIKPAACILGYPCILSSTSPILANPVESLDILVDSSTPPTFIFSASDDKTVPIENSLCYATALAKNNVPFEIHIFNKGGHGFSTASEVVCSDKENLSFCNAASYWVTRAVEWLSDTIG